MLWCDGVVRQVSPNLHHLLFVSGTCVDVDTISDNTPGDIAEQNLTGSDDDSWMTADSDFLSEM